MLLAHKIAHSPIVSQIFYHGCIWYIWKPVSWQFSHWKGYWHPRHNFDDIPKTFKDNSEIESWVSHRVSDIAKGLSNPHNRWFNTPIENILIWFKLHKSFEFLYRELRLKMQNIHYFNRWSSIGCFGIWIIYKVPRY